MILPLVSELADMIDHAILRPEYTRAEVDAELEIATRYRVHSVCVRPSDLPYIRGRLAGTPVALGTVVGFPHGSTVTAAKVAEAMQCVADGAVELDMVLNIGWLRSGLIGEVEADIRAVVQAVPGIPVKVILETGLLNPIQIDVASRAAERAGARFVKTCTGFAGGSANLDDLRIMRAVTTPAVEVKASGGIRDLDTVLRMLEIGVTRFGTSSSKQLLDELEARQHDPSAGGGPPGPRGRHSY